MNIQCKQERAPEIKVKKTIVYMWLSTESHKKIYRKTGTIKN